MFFVARVLRLEVADKGMGEVRRWAIETEKVLKILLIKRRYEGLDKPNLF